MARETDWEGTDVRWSRAIERTFLVLSVWLSLANPASACDVLVGDQSPLEHRKPVRGEGVRLTAGFGIRMHPILAIQRMHTGVDWRAPLGAPVVATARGRVISAEREGEYGNRVIIEHGGPWQTVYAQLASFSVGEGDCVAAGTVIGTVGATSLATAPHLHFDVRHNGQPIDPMVLPSKLEGSEIEGKH